MNHMMGERIDGDSMIKAEIISTDESAIAERLEKKAGSAIQSGAISENAVSRRAYELWLDRGCPEGSPEVDWYKAESELTGAVSQSSVSAGFAAGASGPSTDPGDGTDHRARRAR